MRHPAETVFLAELRDFYVACREPRYRRLAATSLEMRDRHPDIDLPTLSASWVCETLAGNRKGLPDPPMLTVFVLSCRHELRRVHLCLEDSDLEAVRFWQDKLSAARAAARAPDEADTPREHGSYEQELRKRAQAGDAKARYGVGLLVGADPARNAEAVDLLMRAGVPPDGHPKALDLLEADLVLIDRPLAGRHAYELADTAAGQGDQEAAEAFFACSAQYGFGPAAVRLAGLLLERAGQQQAAGLLTAAIDRGDITFPAVPPARSPEADPVDLISALRPDVPDL